MSSNFGKWRFEKRPLLVSIVFGIISFLILLMISNLEFVKESSRTFESTDSIFWTILIAIAMAVVCYGLMLCVEDYMSHCGNKTEGKKFIRKTTLKYFLPLLLIFIAAFVISGIYGVNIFGELIILGTIYFVITFPKFVNKHLPKE